MGRIARGGGEGRSIARRAAAALMEAGNFRGYVVLLMGSSFAGTRRISLGKDLFTPLARRDAGRYPGVRAKGTMGLMQADFFDAHERHWQDAETLHANTRWANADHLYGFSAECGLKRLMQAFEMKLDQDGSPADRKHDRVHVDKAWDRYESYRSGHHNGIGYVLQAANPFSDWSSDQRYARQAEFDEVLVDKHRRGAMDVREKIHTARVNGLQT